MTEMPVEGYDYDDPDTYHDIESLDEPVGDYQDGPGQGDDTAQDTQEEDPDA